MMASVVFKSLLTLVSFARLASGSLFLAKLGEPELRRVLRTEIEAALGGQLGDITMQRLSTIEAALRPTFNVLQKNAEGKLDHDGVRYLLKRTFVQQHRWVVNGLQQGAKHWNASQPKLAMKDYLPEVLQELFEQRVGGKGADLKEVLAFAAMLEHLIRDELRGKLEGVFEQKNALLTDTMETATAANAMELYMMCVIRGQYACSWDPEALERLERSFVQAYPQWPEVQTMIKQTLMVVHPDRTSFTFDAIATALETVSERYARFYETWCQDMKGALLAMEDRRSGRVRLGDFYKAALDGAYQFTESIGTLRLYNVLDESDPANVRVIIPNYVVGVSNCIARTSFYSTCCPDTCETLLQQIEQTVGVAHATPSQIASAVQELDYTGLTVWLRQRLDDVAERHGGKVPLHGRLFVQWLHYLHPRECVYPAMPGTTTNKLTFQTLSKKQITDHVEEWDDAVSNSDEEAMWTMDEELFVERLPEGRSWGKMGCLVLVVLFAASRFVQQNGVGGKGKPSPDMNWGAWGAENKAKLV